MKLYVDDFRDAPDHSWTVCRSNLKAVRLLDEHQDAILQISLDHDISHPVETGGETRALSCTETFEVTVRHIASLKKLCPSWEPKITLHSANVDGANTMRSHLAAVGFEPETMALPPVSRGKSI